MGHTENRGPLCEHTLRGGFEKTGRRNRGERVLVDRGLVCWVVGTLLCYWAVTWGGSVWACTDLDVQVAVRRAWPERAKLPTGVLDGVWYPLVIQTL